MDNKLKTLIEDEIIESIKQIIANSRKKIAQKVNQALIHTYWEVGKIIVENERKKGVDAQTSRQIILALSKKLTNELGRGFSRSNLFNMRRFYLEYKNVQTLSGQLSWSHICELLVIEDKDKRNFYEKETISTNWSIRELKRQIESSLYERLILTQGQQNKNIVLDLSRKGQVLSKPEDIIKNPYVFASKFTYILPDKEKLIKEVENVLKEKK